MFLAEGAKVAITGRNVEKLNQAAKELGGDILAVPADTTDLASLDKAVAAVVAKFGKIDVLFANAGIGGFTPLGQTKLEAFEAVLRTNLTGVFFTVQAASAQLNDGASIIFNGSVISVLGHSQLFRLRGQQGRCTRDGARPWLRNWRAQDPRQCRGAGRHQDADLERRGPHR